MPINNWFGLGANSYQNLPTIKDHNGKKITRLTIFNLIFSSKENSMSDIKSLLSNAEEQKCPR